MSLRAAQAAENTIVTYRTAIRQLAAFCEGLGVPDPREVKRSHIELFFSRMARDGHASGARERFKQLRAFFNWLSGETEQPSVFEHLKEPKGKPVETQTLTPDQVARILTYKGQLPFTTERNRAIVRVLVDTGMRVTELCNVQVEHVDPDDRTIFIAVAKNDKPRTVPFGLKTSRQLARWLPHRPEDGKPFLFLKQTGNKLGRGDVSKITQTMGARADMKGVRPHVFRHTFAHLALLNGMSELDVMRIGGWSKPSMLQRYGSMLADKRARAAHDEYGPGEMV
jgi:integrase/recombinase XerC